MSANCSKCASPANSCGCAQSPAPMHIKTCLPGPHQPVTWAAWQEQCWPKKMIFCVTDGPCPGLYAGSGEKGVAADRIVTAADFKPANGFGFDGCNVTFDPNLCDAPIVAAAATPENFFALFCDGDTVRQIRLGSDPVTALAAVPDLTRADRGLSYGGVLPPGGRALRVSEMNILNANQVSPAFSTMEFLYTNRAAEPSAPGFVNEDTGRLGFAAHNVALEASLSVAARTAGLADVLAKNNGARVVLGINVGGEVFQMPPPSYGGQILMMRFLAEDQFAEAVLDFTGVDDGYLAGVYRRMDGVIGLGLGTDRRMIVRAGESVTLISRAAGVHDVFEHHTRLFHGNGWQENTDGNITLWGTGGTANFPITLLDTSYTVIGTHSAKTVDGFTNGNGGGWMALGGKFDYATAGGVAR